MQHDQEGSVLLRTPIPVVTDADRAAAAAPLDFHPMHDNTAQQFVLFNRLGQVKQAHHIESRYARLIFPLCKGREPSGSVGLYDGYTSYKI